MRVDRAALMAMTAVWVAMAGGRLAQAALASGFIGKVTLDAAYVAGATSATDIAFSGDGRALVTTKDGAIIVRHADGTTATIAYPFPGTLDTDSEKGLLGVVADPAVAQNRTFYFYVSNGTTTADKHRVYRAVLGASTDTLAVDATPIIAASRGNGPGLEGPANHDGGGLFISGGKLFVSVGDTGSNASPPVNKYGSCLNKGNGKILRVNLDGSVPSDNPLVGVASVSACATTTGPWTTAAPDPRIFAWGLRNPWRFMVDTATGLLWIGDVGESTSEEVDIGHGNQHYGYPFVEGSQVWGNVDGMNCNTLTPSRACTPPVFTYGHDIGSAITGGVIVDGCGWKNVFGGTDYVFGDSGAGWIRVLPLTADRTALSSTTPVDFASGSAPVSFRMGPDQSLYVVFNGDGTVQRFTPVSRTGTDCAAAVVPATPGPWRALLGALLGLVGLAFFRKAGGPPGISSAR
ncbi:MAG: PQQ-dependent sugar dehydrogenase [Pseudomonadota bacterium]